MEVLATILGLMATALVGVLTVPAYDGLKKLLQLKGKLPAWVQQLTVPLLAYGLNWLGTVTNFVLPETLELFTADTVSGLLAAGIAMAVKAGKQAKEAKPPPG